MNRRAYFLAAQKLVAQCFSFWVLWGNAFLTRCTLSRGPRFDKTLPGPAQSAFLKNQCFTFAKASIKGLPASTFAKDINDMAQPPRALQPVLLQAKLDSIRIAL